MFSDGQHVGQDIYDRIQTFAKRQKHTFKEISDLVGKALHQVNWSRIDVLALERLRHVKTGRRGTFSRRFNRASVPTGSTKPLSSVFGSIARNRGSS